MPPASQGLRRAALDPRGRRQASGGTRQSPRRSSSPAPWAHRRGADVTVSLNRDAKTRVVELVTRPGPLGNQGPCRRVGAGPGSPNKGGKPPALHGSVNQRRLEQTISLVFQTVRDVTAVNGGSYLLISLTALDGWESGRLTSLWCVTKITRTPCSHRAHEAGGCQSRTANLLVGVRVRTRTRTRTTQSRRVPLGPHEVQHVRLTPELHLVRMRTE